MTLVDQFIYPQDLNYVKYTNGHQTFTRNQQRRKQFLMLIMKSFYDMQTLYFRFSHNMTIWWGIIKIILVMSYDFFSNNYIQIER